MRGQFPKISVFFYLLCSSGFQPAVLAVAITKILKRRITLTVLIQMLMMIAVQIQVMTLTVIPLHLKGNGRIWCIWELITISPLPGL